MGRKIFSDGECHEGQFNEGSLISGEVIFPNKHRLVGEFKNGLLEGEGMEIWPDGAVYKGEFLNGIRDGYGRLFYEKEIQGRQSLKGALVRVFKSRRNNFAVQTQLSNVSLKSESRLNSYCSVNGGKEKGSTPKNINSKNRVGDASPGKGNNNLSKILSARDSMSSSSDPFEILLKEKGEFYEGEWKNGHFYGKGYYQWFDGRRYEGDWVEGLMDGYGEFYWRDGRCYKGGYAKDKKHGYGEFFWPEGRMWKGQWLNGQRVEGVVDSDNKEINDENRTISCISYRDLLNNSHEVSVRGREKKGGNPDR